MLKKIPIALLIVVLTACRSGGDRSVLNDHAEVVVTGAMRNVMWKGELSGRIMLDTIGDKEALYGLGPVSRLAGEILIHDGRAYVARVSSDTTMTVEETFQVSAPFFVHSHVRAWEELALPEDVRTIGALEEHLDAHTKEIRRPFAFKLAGRVRSAGIHVQNLPEGAEVSSPAEAHQGQVNYQLADEEVDIVGFFSTEHQGVFTHHDTFLHMHLITKDRTLMGHLDRAEFGEIYLFVPQNAGP